MSLQFERLDALHLALLELRPEDAREVSEGWRQRCLADPNGTAVVDEWGRVVAIYGAVQGDREVGPWLLCSALIEQYPKRVMRYARGFIKGMRAGAAGSGRLVFNYVPKDSPGNRRFIESLGFRILPSPGPGPDFFYLPHV